MEMEQEFTFTGECRRISKDRRCKPTSIFSRYTLFGDRRKHRRNKDRAGRGYYIDRPHKEMIMIILAIGVLCTLDALLTLYHVGNGAIEINPIMNYYLKMGNGYFFLFKTLITIPSLFILLLHQNFYYIKKVLTCIGGVYSLVVMYHLILFVVVA